MGKAREKILDETIDRYKVEVFELKKENRRLNKMIAVIHQLTEPDKENCRSAIMTWTVDEK